MTLGIIVFGIVFALSSLAGLTFTLVFDKSRRLRRARLTGLGSGKGAGSSAEQTVSWSVSDADRDSLFVNFTRKLKRSGVTASVRQVVGLNGLFALVLGVTLIGLQDPTTDIQIRILIAASLSVTIPPVATNFLLKLLEARRVAKFRESLPEALETMARSLRAGRAASDAVGLIGTSGDDLLASEFRRCRSDIQHGSTLRTAIEALAARVDIPDMHFIAAAISLQHTSGGNLAETLDIAAQSLRQFRQLEAKARALSAEVRMSAIILTALPVFVSVALYVLSPDYLSEFSKDSRGKLMLAYALFSLLCGLLIMKRMEKIDD